MRTSSLYLYLPLLFGDGCADDDLSSGGSSTGGDGSRPNVLIILTDDQFFSDMRCWGGDDHYTPNTDRLAEEGIKFTRAYATSSISSASRYSILSGRYPAECVGEQMSSAYSSRRIQKIDSYIRANYGQRITVEQMAALINISPIAFSRFFKAHTGTNFTDYVADIRIGLVTRMLADSSKSISEICYDCGFNNISNFNRIFKSKKGCSPKEFRDIYKKNKTLF